jgi:hypothetical protein
VKAYGRYLAPIHPFEVTICDLKDSIYTEIRAIKKPLKSGSFNFGAGSIRAYPHAENTGLVISDTAKVQQISFPARVFKEILITFALKVLLCK